MTAQKGNIVGFVDKRQSTADGAGSEASFISNAENYRDVESMRSYLTTNVSGTYDAENVAKLTYNDLVMAVRQHADAGSI